MNVLQLDQSCFYRIIKPNMKIYKSHSANTVFMTTHTFMP